MKITIPDHLIPHLLSAAAFLEGQLQEGDNGELFTGCKSEADRDALSDAVYSLLNGCKAGMEKFCIHLPAIGVPDQPNCAGWAKSKPNLIINDTSMVTCHMCKKARRG